MLRDEILIGLKRFKDGELGSAEQEHFKDVNLA